jgi:predicted NBD/HSP70 family sugar kinase
MYLGIDIGGTKTLVATLTNDGVIRERFQFPTPKKYSDFKQNLADAVANMSTKEFAACGVGVPGRIDRKHGVAIALGNLPWEDAPIKDYVEELAHCPVIVDNDANLGGLSEAMLVKDRYDRVLYITVGTGIGTGIIIDQVIDPAFADSEGGKMLLEHAGKMMEWEDFAGGRAIFERFGKKLKDITDPADWKIIAHNLAIGVIDLLAVVQPQVIVVGGGAGAYFERLSQPLQNALEAYAAPLVPIPPIIEAKRPEDAVIYGCYDLAKSTYGKARS